MYVRSEEFTKTLEELIEKCNDEFSQAVEDYLELDVEYLFDNKTMEKLDKKVLKEVEKVKKICIAEGCWYNDSLLAFDNSFEETQLDYSYLAPEIYEKVEKYGIFLQDNVYYVARDKYNYYYEMMKNS